MLKALLLVHLPAMILWVGSLLLQMSVLAAHGQEGGAEARAALSRIETRIFRRYVHPAAAFVVLSGLLLLLLDPSGYLRAGWFYGKLLLVIVLIGLDLRIYLRARAFQAGRIAMSPGECQALQWGVAIAAVGILVMVIVKPF